MDKRHLANTQQYDFENYYKKGTRGYASFNYEIQTYI
jgi:translation elongation factor EF-4